LGVGWKRPSRAFLRSGFNHRGHRGGAKDKENFIREICVNLWHLCLNMRDNSWFLNIKNIKILNVYYFGNPALPHKERTLLN